MQYLTPILSKLIKVEPCGLQTEVYFSLAFKIEVCTDCMSLVAALSAARVKPPAEKPLLLQVQWLREQLDRLVLSTLTWCDTRDMLADGMTKGAVERTLLRKAMSGLVRFTQAFKSWHSRTRSTI